MRVWTKPVLGVATVLGIATACGVPAARSVAGARSVAEPVTLSSAERVEPVSEAAMEVELGERPDPEATPAALVVTAVPTPAPGPPADPVASTVRPDLGGGYVVTGTTAHRLLLLTFDDGPHPVHTPRVLEVLDRAGVHAVFFVVARRLARPTGAFSDVDDILRDIARRGHVIGSHTRDHEILTRLGSAELEAQIVGAEELITAAIGARPWLLRPPGGMHDAEVDAYLAGRGYSQVLWSVAAEDWLTTDPDVVFENFRRVMVNRERRGTPGGVIVLHDTHDWTVRALPRVLGYIDERNCELLAAGEELYDLVDDPSLFVVARPAGVSPSEPSPPIVLPPALLAERQGRARARAAERCSAGE